MKKFKNTGDFSQSSLTSHDVSNNTKTVDSCGDGNHDFEIIGYEYAACGKRIPAIFQCKKCGLTFSWDNTKYGAIKNPYTSCSYTSWKTVVNNTATTNKLEERHCEHCGKVEYRAYA